MLNTRELALLISKQPEVHSSVDLTDADRALVTMTDAHLGNLVVAMPVMRQMAEEAKKKGIEIRFLIDSAFCELVDALFDKSLCIEYPRKALNKGSVTEKIKAASSVIQAVRKFKPDVTIDLYGTSQPAVIAKLSGARKRVGPASKKWYGRFLTEHACAPKRPEHRIGMYHYTATAAGLSNDIHTAQSSCDFKMLNNVRLKLSKLGRESDKPLVLIHPGAGKKIKIWPSERFAELADKLIAEGNQVAVIGAGADKVLCEKIESACKNKIINLCNQLSVMELFHLYYLADLYIGNDSGPSHLAALTPIKLFSLFGPSESVYWKPLSEKCTVITRDYGSCGAKCKGCDKRQECMEGISVGQVFTTVV